MLDVLCSDSRFTITERADHGLLAYQIDQSHDAAGIAVNQFQRFLIENLIVLTTRDLNSPGNIFLGLEVAIGRVAQRKVMRCRN